MYEHNCILSSLVVRYSTYEVVGCVEWLKLGLLTEDSVP